MKLKAAQYHYCLVVVENETYNFSMLKLTLILSSGNGLDGVKQYGQRCKCFITLRKFSQLVAFI